MSSLSETIVSTAAEQPEGAPITAREFLHLGSRAAIDQALSRLVRNGQLTRVGRGLYVHTIRTRFGERLPSPELVVEALAKRYNETLSPSGAATANSLGLTTQVPTRRVYWTSGRSRRLRIGAEQVELQHVSSWKLSTGQVGNVARAFAWGGPAKAEATLKLLTNKLSPSQRREVVAARSSLPSWVAKTLSPWVNA